LFYVFRLMMKRINLAVFAAALACAGCDPQHDQVARAASITTSTSAQHSTVNTYDSEAQAYLRIGETYNAEAPIPAQCYTKTAGKFNPCYTCHQSYDDERPNRMNDGFLQGSYAFSEFGVENRWKNLFKDRTAHIEQVTDEEILEYIAQDNYSPLIDWMQSDEWQGVVPAIKNLHLGAEAFDEYGLAKDGSRWVAFNYKPLPSTFWPTNGSTDDVMIRLPEIFSDIGGEYSRDIYFANLGLLEMAIAGTQRTSTVPLNEAALDIDLDGDQVLSVSTTTLLRRSHYVGDARDVPLTPMLYPEGTAFLHTVRYLGIHPNGGIYNSPRMKEVRYMKKHRFRSPENLASNYYVEDKEKHFGKLPVMTDHNDRGMANKFGWLVWGFIEDESGRLRKQSHEEQAFCMGCHKSVGTTIDHTFAFPRKVAGASGWGYIDLKKITDTPSLGDNRGEYATYLQRVGGGDEFRQNQEMLERWFHPDGSVDWRKVDNAENIYELIVPSRERALALNKAYHAIVKEQSYIFGRDAVIQPATNVYRQVENHTPPLEPQHRYQWDIRLDWTKQPRP
jgi:hypothetical protein